jgi:thiol-disulfide isomerase/thioredoxin
MDKKTGKEPDKEPDTTARNEPEKQAGAGEAQPFKKIYLAAVVLALVILGCAVIFGSSLLNAPQAPKLPATVTVTPTALVELPAGITAAATTVPKVPAGTTSALTAVYFYADGCAACEKVRPVIADIQARYPELHIESLEVNDNRTNMQTFVAMREQYGVEKSWFAIPTIFIGNKAMTGQTEIKDHLEEYVLAEKQRIDRKSP